MSLKLIPRETDKLHNIYPLAALAARRRDRGTKLNYEEAAALIMEHVLEGARDGKTVAELMQSGREVVKRDECMDGVADILHTVMIECTFPDGTKLVSVHDPIQ